MNFGKFRVDHDAVAPMLMVYWALIAPATLLHYVGLKGLHSTLLVLGVALAFGAAMHRRFRISTLVAAAALVLLSLANMVQWSDYRYVGYCMFVLCALVLVDLAGKTGIETFCTMASTLMMVLLIGAALSFFVAAAGVPPLLALANPDGQDYYFYYTGFSNSFRDSLMRASAIYDEPGAFSMYVCFVAALRHLLGRPRQTTWIILGLGFITFSLAHFVYVLCHFLAEQPNKKRIAVLLGALLTGLVGLVVLATSIGLDANIVLLSRLALTDDVNLFAGDNRSFQMFNAWDQLLAHPSSILFGLGSNCVFSQAACQEVYGLMGENPLSPLAFAGLSSEAPYYIVVGLFLCSPLFGKKYIVLFGIALLFLQRPYVTGFSYALIAVLLLDVAFRQTCRQAGARAPDLRAPQAVPAS